MTIEDIHRRISRLTELSIGLNQERVAWEEAQDPLLYLERKAYLAAVRAAIAGVEEARVVFVRASQRIERKAG